MRRHGKIDSNHSEIVTALRAVGCTVQSLADVGDGCPDLVVGWRGRNLLLEVKPGTAKDKRRRELNEAETKWHREWRGEVHTVLCREDALRLVGVR